MTESPSKRILLATFGSLGDLHPYLALAKELKARGHRPTIATLDRYREAVEVEGIGFSILRPLESQFGSIPEVVRRILNSRKGPEFLIRRIVMAFVRESYEDLFRAADGADLLVSHPMTVTLPLVAEKRGLPWVSTVLSPMSFYSAHDPSVIPGAPGLHLLKWRGPYRIILGMAKMIVRRWERPLYDLRSEIGLPPSKNPAMFEGQFSPRLNLALFSPLMGKTQPDWPPNTRICGFARYDGRPASTDEAADLEAFLEAGEAPIVFTLGSSVSMQPGDYFRAALEAAQRMGRRTVLIAGATAGIVTDLPEYVRVYSYLPYSRIFPRAAVIVHTGGIGTMAQALVAGRPMLVTPAAFDQPDNARRAERLGLARTLPFSKVRAKALVKGIGILLDGRQFSDNAAGVGERVRGENGAQCACDFLLEEGFSQK